MPEAIEIKILVKRIKKFIPKNAIFTGVHRDRSFDELKGEEYGGVHQHGKSIYISIGAKYIKIHLMLYGSISLADSCDHNCDVCISFGTKCVCVNDSHHMATVEKVSAFPTTPDIVSCTEDEFVETLMSKGNRQISAVLVDQKVIPGIGRYLVSDLLYCARLPPFEKIKDIGKSHIIALYHTMKDLFAEIEECGGTAKFGGNYKYKVYRKTTSPKGENVLKRGTVYYAE